MEKKFWNKILKIFRYGVLSVLLSFLIDSQILSAVIMIQSALIIQLFSYITVLGEILSVILIGIFLSIFIVKYKMRLLPLWASLLTVFILLFLVKILIMRPRPFEILETASIVSTNLSSFPSGHSMAAFALLPFVSVMWEKYSYAFWLMAILIAFSRIYLQVHYLSDIVAGAFIGYLISVIYIHLGDKYGWR